MSGQRPPVIIWFRNDLRLGDNEALAAAAAAGQPLIAWFVLDEASGLGAATRWWLHRSLAALAADLRARGQQLVLRRGHTVDVLADLVAQTSAAAVHASAAADPEGAGLDDEVRAALEHAGAALHTHAGALLFSTRAVRTSAGKPFQVFTPFYRACLAEPEPRAPLGVPTVLEPFEGPVASDDLDAWRLRPRAPNWAQGFEATWTPGETGAQARLEAFVESDLAAYPDRRDRSDVAGTSRLSPHLHFGELSPRQVWHVVRSVAATSTKLGRGADAFLRQLVWREFSYHLLNHWPTLPHEAFRGQFSAFPWREDAVRLRAWQRGRTGYPIVDAGMRELWATGWMHNRVRMVAASFLVKHLLIPWQRGAAWFWDTLVDADIANNSASWQWVAGSGADAAPYFRIFNPTLQGQKFDPEGVYVRRWVPELAALPTKHIHAPAAARPDVLADAGIVLGRDYPLPIVEHARARERALEAYRKLPK